MYYRQAFATRLNSEGTGPQTIQVDNGAGQRLGFAPSAMIITVTEQATDTGGSNCLNHSTGVTDGTLSRVISHRSENGITTVTNAALYTDDGFVVYVKTNGTNVTGSSGDATLTSFNATDSVTINWGTTVALDCRIKVEFFYLEAGEEVSADFNLYTATVFTTGFRPSFTLHWECYAGSPTSASNRPDTKMNVGMSAEDEFSTIDQFSHKLFSNDGDSTSNVRECLTTSDIQCGEAYNQRRNVTYQADDTGYTLNQVAGGVISSMTLAVKCTNKVKLVRGSYNTANQTITGAGFTPGAVIMNMSTTTTTNAGVLSGGGSITRGCYDGYESILDYAFESDSVATTVTDAFINTGKLFRAEEPSGTKWAGGFNAFTADGMTTTTTTTAAKGSGYIALFIEELAAPAGISIPVVYHHRQRNV